MLLDYLKASTGKSGDQEVVFWTICAAVLANILIVLELACYFTFFHYMYHHNSGPVVRSAVRRTRNHNNAQTMVGQMYLFLIESIFLGIVIVANLFQLDNSNRIKDIAVTYKLLEFAILSVVHCLQIPEIRLAMMIRVRKLKSV